MNHQADEGSVDPAFKTIPKNSTCFLVWRIEKLKPVPVPKDQYGVFYEGDSYIVLCAIPAGSKEAGGVGMQVKEARGSLDIRLHMWQGKDTSQDEAGVCAYKTVELDDYLGGSPVQYRETEDHESKTFLGYFKSKGGIKYLSGGVASGFNHVEQVVKIRLFHIKGKSTPRVREVPISWSSMNDGDAYILDVGQAQYVWCGKSCSFAERKKAMEFARSQRNSRGKGDLIVVEDGEESASGMGAQEFEVFDDYLPAAQKSQMKSAADGGADDAYEHKAAAAIKLFKCSDESGQFKCEEVGAKPLMKSMLDPSDVFIIDNGEAGIWCWVGKKATKDERKSGMAKASSFIDTRGYSKSTPVTRVIDQGEPPEFRALFKVWEKPKVPGQTKTYSTNRIAQTVQTKFDAMSMHENPRAAAAANMPDDGTGAKKIYRIERQGNTYEMVEQDKRYTGQLYGGDCYIIHYVYLLNGKEQHIIYYWIGKKCTQDEQTAVAFKTVELDDSIGKIGVQIRVVHGKEPKHFMAMFGGKLVIFSGGKAGWAGHDEGPGDKYLLHVRGTSELNSKAEQVDCRAASLNTNDCFVLVSKTAVFLWVGKGATGDEREVAKQVASISPRGYTLVAEGQEKKDFWELLGGQEPYANDPRLVLDEEERPPRLFQCSNASGTFRVEEIVEFVQQDLNPDDVFILDAYEVVWVWVGQGCRSDEEMWSEKAALDYVEKDPAGRDSDTPITKIRQGFEPPNFTGFFGVWDRDLWSQGKSFAELREEMKENNMGMESVIARKEPGSASYSEVAKFSYDDLCKPNEELPAGVDATYKEKHLSAEEFKLVFGMSYEEYNMKPHWKQVQLKKDHKLF